MKKFLIILFVLSGIELAAQVKVNNVVDDDYVRSSISVVVVNRGDQYDNTVFNAVQTINYGEKFDINDIPTDRITIKSSRKVAADIERIGTILNAENVGKEIISYWYQRDSKGVMSDALILKRGMYSVRDQEILNSQVAKVGISALGEKGYDLVKGSYVFVLDYYNLKKDDDTYSVDVNAVIYRIDYSEELLDQVYQAWIYEEDTHEERAKKNALYDSIVVPLEMVTSVKASGSSSSSYAEAIRAAYSNAIHRSENSVDDWNVTSSVISTRPIKAKIGTKEGVKNGQRFQVHKIVEDRKGNLDSKSVGYIRATDVANNSTVATGHTDASSFYQISGGSIDEGMILKQKNDLRLGVTVAGGFGGYSPIEIGVEYLEHINTKGTSRYVMLDLGFDAADSDIGVTFVTAAVGMGMAFRPIRPIEVMPFVQIGADVMGYSDNYLESEDEATEWMAWLARAGARLSWQVVYPVQIFAQVEAAAKIAEGAYYAAVNDALQEYGFGHNPAVAGFSFGLKVSF